MTAALFSLDAQAQPVALRHHQRQHPADPAALEEVLVHEQPVSHEAQAAVDFMAVAHLATHHAHHVQSVAKHRTAHDGGAGAGAGHHAAATVDVPDGIQHRGVLAVRLEGVHDEALGSTREEHRVGPTDLGDQGGVIQILLQVRAFQTRRHRNVLRHRPMPLQDLHDGTGRLLGRCRRGGQHGDLRLPSATRFIDDALPHLVVVEAKVPTDDHGGLRLGQVPATHGQQQHRRTKESAQHLHAVIVP